MALLNDFMAELQQAEAKAATLRKQFDETLSKQAQASFEQIKEILDTYMRFLPQAQRNTILQMLQMKGRGYSPPPGVAKGAKAGTTIAPKYQIPTGETWAGRGQPHKAFSAWSKTAEGRAWHKAHPGQRYPAYPFGAKAPGKPAGASKAAKKSVRKAAKGPRKAPAKKKAKSS